MQVLRYANRVPLQFQQAACAITQAVMGTNWRPYGLSQSRGSLPSGPVTVMVHMASVWVPFTSESKEAIASYPEIVKELRLGLQAVGRKLGMYPEPPQTRSPGRRTPQYLPPLPAARWPRPCSELNGTDREALYEQLLKVAKRKTAEADLRMDERGRLVER